MTRNFSKSELASKLTDLYFREVARIGFKRSLEVEEIVSAYYYALKKLDE